MIRTILMMLVIGSTVGATLALLLRVLGFPAYLRFAPDKEHVYQAPFPLSLVVKSDQAGIIRLPRGETASKKGGACTALVVGPNRLGKANVEVRLFGVIPVRRLVIDVSEPSMVIPSGHAIGVLLASKGVVIVGHIPLRGVDGKERHPAREAGLSPGDVLTGINGEPVKGVDDVERLVCDKARHGPLTLTICRKGRTMQKKIRAVTAAPRAGFKSRYMLGIYVQDPAAGVGTLTFYEPATGRFAALGHMVNHPAPHVRLEAGEGRIVEAEIAGVEEGLPGEPGEKIGTFRPGKQIIGTVFKNCRYGIYGRLDHVPGSLSTGKAIPVAQASEVEVGPAEIMTVLSGDKVRCFKVRIERVSRQSRPADKGIVLVVTDPDLLSKTNGIVQGMSGSPILQHGKLVGAVTHVFVNDPRRGYGVLAEWMWYEASHTRIPGLKAPEQVSGALLFDGLPIHGRSSAPVWRMMVGS